MSVGFVAKEQGFGVVGTVVGGGVLVVGGNVNWKKLEGKVNKLLVVGGAVVALPEDPPESEDELGIVVVAFGDIDCVEGIWVLAAEEAITEEFNASEYGITARTKTTLAK